MDEFERLHADRSNNCCTTMEAEGEGWEPKVDLSPPPAFPHPQPPLPPPTPTHTHNLLLTVPMRYFYCGSFLLYILSCPANKRFGFNDYVRLRYLLNYVQMTEFVCCFARFGFYLFSLPLGVRDWL